MISLFLFNSFTFFSVASVFDFRCTAGTFTRFKFDQNFFSCFAIPLQLSLVFFFLRWRPSSLLRWLHTWMTVIITFLFFFTPNICRQRRVSVQRSSLDKIWWPWSTGTYYPDLLDTADKTVFCRAACVDRLYSYLCNDMITGEVCTQSWQTRRRRSGSSSDQVAWTLRVRWRITVSESE